MSRIHRTDACWFWLGAADANGYGKLGDRDKVVYAHRVMWERENGPIPPGGVIMHTCDTPGCIRPEHLRLGTDKDNAQDMVSKGRVQRYNAAKTRCKRGHPFNAANTFTDQRGHRGCRACRKINKRLRKERTQC